LAEAAAVERREINLSMHLETKQIIQQAMAVAEANLKERAFKAFLDYLTAHL
jgi:hypothetical protein